MEAGLPFLRSTEKRWSDPTMADQDVNRLLERKLPEEQGGPLSTYGGYLVLLLMGILMLLPLAAVLPSPSSDLVNWIIAFLAGVVVAGFFSLLVLAVWLKSWPIGLALGSLTLIAWMAWLAALALPGQLSAIAFTILLALGVPVVAGLWFARLADGIIAGLGSLIWLVFWGILTFAFNQQAAGVLLLVCALGTTGALLGVSSYLAGFLLPEERGKKRRKTVIQCLRDQVLGWNLPYYLIVDEAREEDKIVKRGGDPFVLLASGPGIVVTDCDHAVAISDGTKFKGVKGPGMIFTKFGDRPLRTFDLRPQLRATPVQSLTRDGIQVKVTAFTPFRIDAGDQRPQLGEPFPYRRSAAFKVLHAQEMEHPSGAKDTQQRSWDELPSIVGKRVLQDLISEYRFDELYGPYDTVDGEVSRARIARQFRTRLAEELIPFGIQLRGGGISNLEPVNEDILRQRVRSWQANWTRRVLIKQAKSQAEWLRRIERARAEAQADLILAMGERLTEMEEPHAHISAHALALHFLHILEERALQPGMQRFVPRTVLEDVGRMRGALGSE